MKKLAVLLLVLSVASLAQASFFLTINGQDVTSAVVPVGQSVTVGIHSTDSSVPPEPTAWGEYGMYHELTLWAYNPSYGASGTMTNGVIKADAGATAAVSGGGTNLENSYWTAMNPTPTPGLWFEWTFTNNTAGDSTLSLLTWGPAWTSTVGSWDSVAISSIPEPATMSLLGLGAVALFRRK